MLVLSKKPKNVTVIEGFPGFGLVATITTEYLINHLKCEKIGSYWFTELPASVAIHKSAVIDPISFYYCKDYNLVIVHAIAPPNTVEWKAAEMLMELCKQLQAKQLVCLEGIGSSDPQSSKVFTHTNDEMMKKKLGEMGVGVLDEGIIIGTTGALLLQYEGKHTCLFAETHSSMPDSKAASEIVTVLDRMFGLEVDPKPLLKKAEEFEEKIKGLMEKTAQAKEVKEQKELSYMG